MSLNRLTACVWVSIALLSSVPTAQADEVPWSSPQVLDAAADGAFGIAVGDINNDGDLDVVAISLTDNTLAWYDNGANAHGGFVRREVSADMRGPQRVRLGDMDGDGWLDIVCTCATDGAVRVIFNDGTPANGGWVSNPWAIGQGPVVGLALADLDRDGDLDIAFSIPSSGRVAWLENDGSPRSGAATTRNLTAGAGDTANDLDAADFTRDGFIDVVAANGAGGTSGSGVVWWENDGSPANGGWTRTVVANGQASPFQRILAADITGDNRADLIGARADGTVLWYRSTGAGTFIAATLGTGVPDPRGIAAGDIDGDTDVDVAVAGFTNDEVRWFDNAGGLAPTFTSRTLADTLDGASAVALGDFGEDGDLDAAVCAFNADDVVLVENTKIHSTSQFAPFQVMNSGPFDSLGQDIGLDVGDLDNDGDQDIVRTSTESRNTGYVWHEHDATPLSGNWTTRTIDNPRDFNDNNVIVVDADADGDLDFAGEFQVALAGAGFGFFLNDGSPANGGWNQQTEDPVVANRGFQNVFDLDGDGDQDVIISSFEEAPFQIDWDEFRPHDTIKWTRHQFTLDAAPQSRITGIAAADLDNDGDPDLVVLDIGSAAWYENPGSLGGTFTRHTLIAPFSGTFFVFVRPICADIDRDGRIDVLLRNGSIAVIARNLGGSPPTFARVDVGAAATSATAQPQTGDADHDGDLDVLVTSHGQAITSLTISECATIAPLSFAPAPLTIPSGTAAEGAFSDVDRDGLLDIIGVGVDGFADTERLFIIRNRGGQAKVTGDTAIPPGAGAYDAQETALLTMNVQHLGRAGDHAAEIGEVRVLLERLPGLVLTPAQVSELFFSVAIFRDTNADGIADPTDVLVDRTTFSTHTPATNPMVLSIADANTDADIPATQARQYLITGTLRADAHRAAVNAFIGTLVLDEDTGPVGVDVQDAPANLPVRLAHSEDAHTGLVTALCTADFNGDRVLNSQDFFDFLTAFFAQAASADFNRDSVLNSQDFFDFLVAFFAGC